jgi:hypothetical protein
MKGNKEWDDGRMKESISDKEEMMTIVKKRK